MRLQRFAVNLHKDSDADGTEIEGRGMLVTIAEATVRHLIAAYGV